MSELHYDKNAKIIVIPYGTTIIDHEDFMNNDKVEEIVIPSSVEYISVAAFKGCKSLKKINLPNSLQMLAPYAFSECESLEEITIPPTITNLSPNVFSHCHNLKTVNSHDEICYIEDSAFFDCKNLENFDIPSNTSCIGRMAFMGCEKIKEITIPQKTEYIEEAAFALMSSLEKINVDDNNQKYCTINDNTTLISNNGVIMQYAINSNLENIEYHREYNGISIYNISDYAFAGAKKLKKIYLPSRFESIGKNTFLGCDNLKDLEISNSTFGSTFLINIYNNLEIKEPKIPFENITINEGVKSLADDSYEIFKNAKNVTLPNSLQYIGRNVFTKSKYLNSLNLPSNLRIIKTNAFYPEIEIKFHNFKNMKAKELNSLVTMTNAEIYEKTKVKDNIKILSLIDGTYYIKVYDYDIVKIKKDDINKLSSTSNIISNNPDDLIIYLINLLNINKDYNGIMSKIWINPNLKQLFNELITNTKYINELSSNKISKIIKEIFNTNKDDELLFNGIIMRYLNSEDIIQLIENYNSYIDRFFRLYPIKYNINIDINKLIKYCSFLQKYNIKDKYLYNPIFFKKLSEENQELLIKYFNKNIKHLLNNSKTTNDSYGNNLNDLLNLCNSLGVFSPDKRISQQISTFINEKMFLNDKIVGDEIHTIFGDIKPRKEIDYEFVKFFIQNYNKLIELEKNTPGIITNIYNSFIDISKTSTSHRGEQRSLKVTIDKCLDYFLTTRFEGITEENKDLAKLLQKYYSESYALQLGEMIVKESKCAPRNIFSKIQYDTNGNKIFSYDSNEDLIDDLNNEFYYQWLPKQDYDNLILGKYCNCCAHILSAGAGITRASMILDNCQNLVIRNNKDQIIAKMTIYVNREHGYAVFNTAEVNSSYRHSKDKICEAFLRGVNDFIDKYNSNNDIKITIVTIGEYRNIIKYDLGNIETNLYATPNYSNYGYYYNETKIGTYDGDSKKKQILVLKK